MYLTISLALYAERLTNVVIVRNPFEFKKQLVPTPPFVSITGRFVKFEPLSINPLIETSLVQGIPMSTLFEPVFANIPNSIYLLYTGDPLCCSLVIYSTPGNISGVVDITRHAPIDCVEALRTISREYVGNESE